MPSIERGLVFTNDLDGVHFKAPIPFKTTLRFLRGDCSLPPKNRPVGEYQLANGLLGIVSSRWSIFFHQIRPINKDALAGLELFRQVTEAYQRQLQIAALSGREKDKHVMTEVRLQQTGHMQYFNRLFLNPGNSSASWKETVTRQLIQEGLNVIHIDDDLRAGLCVARVNGQSENEAKVQVYVLRNLSNHPRLLSRAKVQIPDNLVFVTSFQEAANDFADRLKEGKL